MLIKLFWLVFLVKNWIIFFLSHFYLVYDWSCNFGHVMKIILLCIIWCIFHFLIIVKGPVMWPSNNCLQVIVWSCPLPSDIILLPISFPHPTKTKGIQIHVRQQNVWLTRKYLTEIGSGDHQHIPWLTRLIGQNTVSDRIII